MSRDPWKLDSTSTLALLEYAPAAIVATTAAGQIRFANQRALAMFGHGASALRDQPFDRLLAEPAWPARAALWQQYQTALVPRDDIRLRGQHRDGSEMALRISLGHAHLDGVLHLVASMQRDLRHDAAHDRELEAAKRELESFSYSVSHDLRAPLRAIDGFSMVLEKQYAETLNEHAKGLLGRVRGAAQRMSGLIDDLVRLSRIVRSSLTCERFDLSTLAGDVAEGLRSAHPERSADMVIEPGMTCFGDPGLLRILLDSLLGNAWKYTSQSPHARIELGTTMQGDERVYVVRDNGAGFDMKYADKLFAPFQRLHSGHEFPGNGIGLATAARIVHQHGGRIWAEATVNQGAAFYFTLAADGDGEP